MWCRAGRNRRRCSPVPRVSPRIARNRRDLKTDTSLLHESPFNARRCHVIYFNNDKGDCGGIFKWRKVHTSMSLMRSVYSARGRNLLNTRRVHGTRYILYAAWVVRLQRIDLRSSYDLRARDVSLELRQRLLDRENVSPSRRRDKRENFACFWSGSVGHYYCLAACSFLMSHALLSCTCTCVIV